MGEFRGNCSNEIYNCLPDFLSDIVSVDWSFGCSLEALFSQKFLHSHSVYSHLALVYEICDVLQCLYETVRRQKNGCLFLVGGNALSFFHYAGDIDLWINSTCRDGVLKELFFHLAHSQHIAIQFSAENCTKMSFTVSVGCFHSLTIALLDDVDRNYIARMKIIAIDKRSDTRIKCVDLYENCCSPSEFITILQRTESQYKKDRAALFPRENLTTAFRINTVRYIHPSN